MARDWANVNTVAGVLTNAGYYPTDPHASKQDLQSQFVEEETVDIGGKQYTLSRISKYDVKIFADQLDKVCSRLNPFIWDIYAKYAVWELATVRLANIQSKQGFRGAGARGNELDCSLFNARQFQDPDAGASTLRSSWVRTISSTGSKNFMTASDASSALTMGEEESLIYLAWYNPALDPCSDMFQITLNTDLFDWQDLDFNKVDDDEAEPIIELKEPWILPPEEAGLIQVRYFQTGTDEIRPIGLWVKMAKNMRAMATP